MSVSEQEPPAEVVEPLDEFALDVVEQPGEDVVEPPVGEDGDVPRGTQTPIAAPDPRDDQIRSLTALVLEQARQGRAEPRAAPREPETDPFEAEAYKLGFGNVGEDRDADGNVVKRGVNMVPALMKLFKLHGDGVVGSVRDGIEPRLTAIGDEIVGTKFGRALDERIPKARQTADFVAFRDRQLQEPMVAAVRQNDPAAAADIIDARWRRQHRQEKVGERRAESRMGGGQPQRAAPRGSNRSSQVLKVAFDDPNLSDKINDAAARGIDHIEWLPRKRA